MVDMNRNAISLKLTVFYLNRTTAQNANHIIPFINNASFPDEPHHAPALPRRTAAMREGEPAELREREGAEEVYGRQRA
jgi:hypothetical protein